MRRTGLTFAPEGGSWRIRQVINKLITEEDLYAAVDGAYSQGWRRVKLYFLIGLPTEMDEDTLGIAELAREVVEDRPQVHEEGELHRVGRRVRAEGRTRRSSGSARTASTSCSARSACCATTCKRTRRAGAVARPRRDVRRGHRAAAATGASAGSSSGCGARGGTFQEWSEHFALDRWLDAMAAEGLDPDWYVTRHRTARRDPARGTTSPPACTATSSGTTGRRRCAEHGLPDCRWTPCYDCGVCTDYALEHVVASAVPPAGGSQGTGQDLELRRPSRRVPVELLGPVERASDEGRRGLPGADPLHEAGQGAVRSRTATSPGAFERAFRIEQLPLAFTEGFSPRPKVSFGLALSVGHESDAEYLDVELARTRSTPTSLAGRAHRGAARGHRRHRRRAARRARAGPAGIGHRGRVPGRDRRRSTATPSPAERARRSCVDRALASDDARGHADPQGKESVDDIRPAIRLPSRSVTTATVAGARAHPVDAIPRCPSA